MKYEMARTAGNNIFILLQTNIPKSVHILTFQKDLVTNLFTFPEHLNILQPFPKPS